MATQERAKGLEYINWRLIPLLNAPGAVQMALDTWLFDQHCQGFHPPTLRFYTWTPAAISLGYHQHRYPESWQQLRWQGKPIDLVRRPTGGRAVLHQGDLTYAIVMSGLPESRMEAYQHICKFLIQGWRSLNIDLHYGHAGRGYIHNPNCFGTATTADLVLPDGTKFIGSAQVRKRSTILQHGSMRLTTDPTLFHQVFGEDLGAIAHPYYTQLPTCTESITTALTDAACSCFKTELHPQPLSDAEWQAIFGVDPDIKFF